MDFKYSFTALAQFDLAHLLMARERMRAVQKVAGPRLESLLQSLFVDPALLSVFKNEPRQLSWADQWVLKQVDTGFGYHGLWEKCGGDLESWRRELRKERQYQGIAHYLEALYFEQRGALVADVYRMLLQVAGRTNAERFRDHVAGIGQTTGNPAVCTMSRDFLASLSGNKKPDPFVCRPYDYTGREGDDYHALALKLGAMCNEMMRCAIVIPGFGTATLPYIGLQITVYEEPGFEVKAPYPENLSKSLKGKVEKCIAKILGKTGLPRSNRYGTWVGFTLKPDEDKRKERACVYERGTE